MASHLHDDTCTHPQCPIYQASLRAPEPTATPTIPPTEVPRAWNGYVAVAKPAIRVPASEVLAGDVLILDGYVSKVSRAPRVMTLPPEHGGQVVFIPGDVNIVRFTFEMVSVIRSDA